MMKTPALADSVDTEKCVTNVGNRFDLVLIASHRTRELRRGHRKQVNSTNGHVVSSLQEIEAGLVGRDYLKKI